MRAWHSEDIGVPMLIDMVLYLNTHMELIVDGGYPGKQPGIRHWRRGKRNPLRQLPSVAYPSSGGSRTGQPAGSLKPSAFQSGRCSTGPGSRRRPGGDTFDAKQLHDEYTESPEYMALLRGALSMMKVSHIDLLIVGLPVALFSLKGNLALEKTHGWRTSDRRRERPSPSLRRWPLPNRRVRLGTTRPSTRRWQPSNQANWK